MRHIRLARIGGLELSVTIQGQALELARSAKSLLRSSPATVATPRHLDTPKNAAQAALIKKIEEIPWYHTIELDGIFTPGFFDHTPALGYYHLPESMAGMRVLDVATYNGFWAFEFERRGASEVIGMDIETAADIDLNPAVRRSMTPEQLSAKTGRGFELASAFLGSKVKREILNIYDLSPERLGKFDLVFCGDLLVHLTNPVRALQNIASVTRGAAILTEMYDPNLDLPGDYRLTNYLGGKNDYVWWMFGYKAFEAMVQDAGFGSVAVLETAFPLMPRGYSSGPPHALFHASGRG